MRTVRAIFTTHDRLYREVDGEKTTMIVELAPCYSPDPKDANNAFWKATPAGNMKMTITNPDVFDLFVPGKNVTLDFTFDE